MCRLTCAGVLVLTLVLSEHHERVREYYPFFGFVSVPIVMSERVEMTISKGVLRIGGTIVGGTLGFLVMLHPGLATNPHLLMVSFKCHNQTIFAGLLLLTTVPACVADHLCMHARLAADIDQCCSCCGDMYAQGIPLESSCS